MPFRDRTEAGEQLARALHRLKGEDVVVLALPRGGLPVAMPVAENLNAPLDLLLVRKIGVPFQPELAMGAILEGKEPIVVRNEDVIRVMGISSEVFEKAKDAELSELERRSRVYRNGRTMTNVEGKTVIIVDDGIATGATVRAALKGIRQLKPAKTVLAVPLAPESEFAVLSKEADDFVCLENLGPYGAISMHYGSFRQLSDGDVVSLLEQVHERESADSRKGSRH